MTVQLANVAFDCDDVLAVARFWSAALDRPIDPDPSEYFASIGLGERDASGSSGPSWLFAQVPEKKSVKNRVHVDLAADSRDAVQPELDRLVALGATVIRTPKDEFGHYWATLQDPEGNEFCIGAP